MPGLDNKVWVEDGVHLDTSIGDDLDDRGKVEDPAEEIQRACEDAKDPAVLGARGDGRPVVNATGRGDGGGELGRAEYVSILLSSANCRWKRRMQRDR